MEELPMSEKITSLGIYLVDKQRLFSLLIKHQAKTGKKMAAIKFVRVLLDTYENGGIKCQE